MSVAVPPVGVTGNALVPGQHDHAWLPIRVAQRPGIRYELAMPDDLDDREAPAWSEHQASLLRRVARGERVNEVDWEHVIEEIEDVGVGTPYCPELSTSDDGINLTST